MTSSGNAKGTFDGAHGSLRRVHFYLMGSPESLEEPVMRLIKGLYNVAEPLLALWRTVTGVDGTVRGGGTITGRLSEVRDLRFRAPRVPASGEGTTMESHLIGTDVTLNELINLLSDATGPAARSTASVRKKATTTHQNALHQYAAALRAPDTVVAAERRAAHHDRRIELTRRLHRGVVDIAGGVEAWTR